ncbi:hypothetical protein [Pseudoruegeria sp. HB172150]|uniref:hypothetical protein n=1 Tax=Pseudoruegeria sp. HB172150 TaxID=2721164 RepID=UPI001558184A|nr:hypothetical protein [Pseudoruegeria sp. HB172150]
MNLSDFDFPLEAVREWSPAIAFDGRWLGIYPKLNAVVELNESGKQLWEAVRVSTSASEAVSLYCASTPCRAPYALADFAGAHDRWARMGLFSPPETFDPPTVCCSSQIDWDFRQVVRLGATSAEVRVFGKSVASALSDIFEDCLVYDRPSSWIELVQVSDRHWLLSGCNEGTRVLLGEGNAVGACVGLAIRLSAGNEHWKALFHAACVSKGDHTVLLHGESGAGKSTLAAALVAHGWQLVSEDISPLGAAGLIQPMPLAVSTKSGGWEALNEFFPSLSERCLHRLGRKWVRYLPFPEEFRAHDPCRPTHVVKVKYDAHSIAECVKLSPFEALNYFFDGRSYIDFEAENGSVAFSMFNEARSFAIQYGCTKEALSILDRYILGSAK